MALSQLPEYLAEHRPLFVRPPSLDADIQTDKVDDLPNQETMTRYGTGVPPPHKASTADFDMKFDATATDSNYPPSTNLELTDSFDVVRVTGVHDFPDSDLPLPAVPSASIKPPTRSAEIQTDTWPIPPKTSTLTVQTPPVEILDHPPSLASHSCQTDPSVLPSSTLPLPTLPLSTTSTQTSPIALLEDPPSDQKSMSPLVSEDVDSDAAQNSDPQELIDLRETKKELTNTVDERNMEISILQDQISDLKLQASRVKTEAQLPKQEVTTFVSQVSNQSQTEPLAKVTSSSQTHNLPPSPPEPIFPLSPPMRTPLIESPRRMISYSICTQTTEFSPVSVKTKTRTSSIQTETPLIPPSKPNVASATQTTSHTVPAGVQTNDVNQRNRGAQTSAPRLYSMAVQTAASGVIPALPLHSDYPSTLHVRCLSCLFCSTNVMLQLHFYRK